MRPLKAAGVPGTEQVSGAVISGDCVFLTRSLRKRLQIMRHFRPRKPGDAPPMFLYRAEEKCLVAISLQGRFLVFPGRCLHMPVPTVQEICLKSQCTKESSGRKLTII
jgi:hypothetical protein